jgi:hypothetical protein
MTLTLKESCRLYEQYCRRRTSTPTFEEFNEKNGTCLPSSDTIYTDFKKSIDFARKNEGLPIRSRLKSLYNQLSKESPKSIAKNRPSVQIRPASSNSSSIPSITNSFSMNIRTPEKASIKNEEMKKVESEDGMNWSTESYKKLLSSTSCKKVIESNGLMVHLVSSSGISTEEELRATSCKLTKNAWNTLLGKSDDTLTMRDGSSLKMSSIKMDSSDLQKFVTSRKKKENGPYFIRFRTI